MHLDLFEALVPPIITTAVEMKRLKSETHVHRMKNSTKFPVQQEEWRISQALQGFVHLGPLYNEH